jgi:hypothetical protein
VMFRFESPKSVKRRYPSESMRTFSGFKLPLM